MRIYKLVELPVGVNECDHIRKLLNKNHMGKVKIVFLSMRLVGQDEDFCFKLIISLMPFQIFFESLLCLSKYYL